MKKYEIFNDEMTVAERFTAVNKAAHRILNECVDKQGRLDRDKALAKWGDDIDATPLLIYMDRYKKYKSLDLVTGIGLLFL